MKTINGESVVGSGDIKIDLSLYKVVTDFPTSNIDATKIYLKLASSTAEKNVYAEYIYTGDTTAAYDASKWEKLGEAQTSIIVDTALSTTSTNPVQNKIVNKAIEDLKTSVGGVQSDLNSNVQALQNKNATQDAEIAKKVNTTTFNTEMAKKLDKTTKASDTVLGLVQTGHVASDGELPLKVDSDGKGYVVIESMSTEDIDALFK